MRRHGDRNDAPTGSIEGVLFQVTGYVALAVAVIVLVLR